MRAAAIVLGMALSGCGPIAAGGAGCSIVTGPLALHEAIAEASGAAVSSGDPDVIWTHNDGGSRLFAVRRSGELVATYTFDARVRDPEDVAVSRCGAGSCLYLADVGDNGERRPGVAILRIPEPDPGPGVRPADSADPAAPARVGRPVAGRLGAERFPARLPDGPRDIEAIAVLPGERILLITKGRNHAVTVYRYPGALRPDTVTLVEVQRLSDGPRILPRQVTGASASPAGDVVAVRTYESLRLYRVDGDTLAEIGGSLLSLRPLGEVQGEGVALGTDGRITLTSEAGPAGGRASVTTLRCPPATESAPVSG